jgi:cobalt-zinc-cadmium efflux system protein
MTHHTHDHGHHHGHGHGQGHDHGHHHHAPASFGRAFAIGISLNLAFVVVEAAYGILGNSVALLADAGHNLSDVLGLVVAWAGSVLAARAPSTRFTYGLRRSSILAALANATFLMLAIGGLSWEALTRFTQPEPVHGVTVMIVAAIGVVINGLTAWLFASCSKGDINLRGAFLHMLADALVSVGVIAAGLVILLTGWNWLDPVVSLVINVVIVWGAWGLLSESLRMTMDAVPDAINPEAVRDFLLKQSGVVSVHDLHIWPMSTTETALTCHLVMPAGHPGDGFLHHVCDDLNHRFGIHHSTMQIEIDPSTACALAPDSVV